MEGQLTSLRVFIKKLADASPDSREEMLAEFKTDPSSTQETTVSEGRLVPGTVGETSQEANAIQNTTLARSRAGQMRRRAESTRSHFYGGTSSFHIYQPDHSSGLSSDVVDDLTSSGGVPELHPEASYSVNAPVYFAPHDDTSQHFMASYFKHQYQHSMCVYREFFLRDYDSDNGRYYSDLLLFAICAVGATATGNSADLPLSHVFASQAEFILHEALDKPDLTVLQALLLLGQREISQRHASRGWLYCGMAFRLAHEMGLHLDPSNWDGTFSAEIDREVLRRVYWAAFVVDKQLSLHFGRPPALHPYESDVRNTVRIPYPPDWESLLDTYIAPKMSATAYEDGLAVAGSFIYHAELAKIQHTMITDLFENRRKNADNAVIAATIHNIHLSLEKWLAGLPKKLYWSQWTLGQVPAPVLHLQ